MMTFDELNQQNHEITALTNVLRTLIDDRLVLDNDIVSELFFRYFDAIEQHLSDEQPLYASLLAGSDQVTKNTTNQFISGTSEIRRILHSFVRRWSKNRSLLINDHEKFVDDAKDIFKLVRQRIRNETERLYPLVRQLAA